MTIDMEQIDSYKRPDGCECVLLKTGAGWTVQMWTADDDLHWEVSGVTEGGVSDGFRTVGGTWVPFDETAARAEFERWRA